MALATIAAVAVLAAPGTSRAGAGKVEDDGTMELELHFRFPPTDFHITRARSQVQRASRMLCDATEGGIRIDRVRLTGGAAAEDAGDVWWFPDQFRSFSDVSGLGRLGSHIVLGQDDIRADVLAHELGHLAFGLGDSYDEQRRVGGPCGIGPSFDPGTADELNHSIMQQDGYQQCLTNQVACYTDADCPPGDRCDAVLMSEFSTFSNHDPVRADGGFCPLPRQTTAFRLVAQLERNATAETFDATDFATAEATSQLMTDVEILDSLGEVTDFFEGSSAHRLKAFFEHTGPAAWTIHFGIDDGDLAGGTPGALLIVGSVGLAFQPDGTLIPLSPEPRLDIAGLANGARDLFLDVVLELIETDAPSEVFLAAALNGLPRCTADYCPEAWNATTFRFETSQQTLLNGESDWNTLSDNFPFLRGIPGNIAAEAPPICDTPVRFLQRLVGSDQVMLVIDRSGSMADPVSPDSDEKRLDYAKAAARGYVDLFAGRGGDLGVIVFAGTPTLLRGLDELETADAEALKDRIDDTGLRSETAIGSALLAALDEFVRTDDRARARTVYLLSDGQNTVGPDPKEAARELREHGVRIFSIPVGSTADRGLLVDLARQNGGTMLNAPHGDELPPIYAELFARFRGESLVLPRTESAVAGRIGEVTGISALAASLDPLPLAQRFPFSVEAGAEALNVMLSARDMAVSRWGPGYMLSGPGGEQVTDLDPSVKRDPFYRLLRVAAPTPGEWTLDVFAQTPVSQESFLLAHVENGLPDCFTDAGPAIAPGGPVPIGAVAAFGADLEGASFAGSVRRPDGTSVPLDFRLNELTRTTSALFEAFAGRGVYEVSVECTVPASARPVRGESSLDGPERHPISAAPFVRRASGAFFFAGAQPPPCASTDCDGDGIPNDTEGEGDADGDLLPNQRDDDADGDDIPDSIEGAGDTDQDGVPDFLDTDSDGDGVPDANEGLGDTDGDGGLDFRDLDADGDGRSDGEEGTADPDGDGLPNFQDPDSDGDGIADADDPFPYSVCGNGALDPGEACDDGNRAAGDGCSPRCEIENRPPECGTAFASSAQLWPPRHQVVAIAIRGVTDPDSDPLLITVTGIGQDEALNALGDGNTCPDAAGIGTAAAHVRSERSGRGDGRVYHVAFTAADGRGGSCDGEVQVCVPHDPTRSCVDQGALSDSTGPCPHSR